MTTTTTRTGSRIKLPPNALKLCASCLIERGNRTNGWHAIIDKDGARIGWTCPACPTTSEPIRLEPSGRFVAVVGVRGDDGKRRQLKRRFDRLDDARAWVAEVKAGAQGAARQGRTYLDPSRFTVDRLVDEWLAAREREVLAGELRRVTFNGYAGALRPLQHYLGHMVARDVRTPDVNDALRRMATNDPARGGKGGKKLSHRSRSYALGALRQVYKHALAAGWVTLNPAQDAKVGGEPGASRRAQRWTVERLVKFRAHVDEAYTDAERLAAEPWGPAAMRLALCGLRRSEVLGLAWENVDLDAETVTIAASRVVVGKGGETDLGEPKSENSARVVAVEQLHPGTVKALRALWLAQGRPASGLVVKDSAGQPVHPYTFSWRFRTLCKDAEVPHPGSVHNTRHTLATALMEAGVPDNQGAALLGHDVATYRKFYAITDADAGAAAASAAGRIFAATGTDAEDFRAL